MHLYNINLEMLSLPFHASILLLLMLRNSIQCDYSTCLKCSSYYNNNEYCLCNRSGYYLDQYGVCQWCSPCYECTNKHSCTSCYGSYILFGSDCVSECPDGYEYIEDGCSQKTSPGVLAGIIIGTIIGFIFIPLVLGQLIRKCCTRNPQQPIPQPQPPINAARAFPYLQQAGKGNSIEISIEQINVVPSIRNIQQENSKEVCSICLESHLNTALKCGHTLHLRCLSEWMKRSSLCPLCRAEIGRESQWFA